MHIYALDLTDTGSCSFTCGGCSLHPENVWLDTCLPVAKAQSVKAKSLHQQACLFFMDLLDSTFVTVTVLNSSMEKSFIEAPSHMIYLKIVILKICLFFPSFFWFVDLSDALDALLFFFFLKRCFSPDCEVEDNLTWEKLSFSRNWGFLKVEKGTSYLKMR